MLILTVEYRWPALDQWVSYIVKNTSENLLSVDILMLGESYHNNHHKFPSALNFGRRWHEIDPIYPVIRFLGWLKIIQLPKTPPACTGENSF